MIDFVPIPSYLFESELTETILKKYFAHVPGDIPSRLVIRGNFTSQSRRPTSSPSITTNYNMYTPRLIIN